MTTQAERRREMPKAYDPRQVEERLYRFWEERGYFKPAVDPEREPFTIIMPPPNVTGELHLGHALTATIEDILIRWHRMRGDPTLWLPGVDHAGIATQNVVERELAKEGLTRHDLGRERFLERVWEWVRKYRHIITDQHRRLGASCDWDRETFTMDPGPQRAVRTTFVRLYRDGLIYRGERIINWCPRCMTALSDLEVNHEEEQGFLWHVRYPLLDDQGNETGEYVEMATTRPETIVGDTGVAVNPEDERYRHLVGRKARLPIIGREIPVVADGAVDPAFGTGAVKVTPGHDPNDFEIGERHGLPPVLVMNLDGTMNEHAGPYAGMDRFQARQAIVRDFQERGLLGRVEPHVHAVGHCDRCGTIVEPIISKQWFVKVGPLAEPARRVVEEGRIRIVPERFTKIYLNWMENIRDWCISRQLWWGHRIPVWYCRDCPEVTVAVEDPDRCAGCGSRNIEQDPDVLDTWFSSGLWPHSTLGWPDQTEDLRYFYPTSVMETGYDILFFWVARMIMLGLYNMQGVEPFRVVYLHGLVRDAKGEKMSKSKGNVVNPLDAMNRYGTDALRFTLATGGTPGNDQRLSDQRLEGGRNFANKLWNLSRFVILSLEGEPVPPPDRAAPAVEDRWILSRLDRLVESVAKLLEDFQLGEAGRQVHDFVWSEFADWYVELSKVRLRAGDRSPLPVLVHVLQTALRLLHPYMPFVTEEIWQNLRPAMPGAAEALMVAPFPSPSGAPRDEEAERQAEAVMDAIRAIRNVRSERGVEATRRVEAYVAVPDAAYREAFQGLAPAVRELARVEPLHLVADPAEAPRDGVATAVLAASQVVLPLAGLVDLEAERRKLQRAIDGEEANVRRLEARLADQAFRTRAPREVVAREEEKLEAARTRLAGLRQALAELS